MPITFPAIYINCKLCYAKITDSPPCSEAEARILNCNHIFHKACIGEWLKNQDFCPVCLDSIKVTPTPAGHLLAEKTFSAPPENPVFFEENGLSEPEKLTNKTPLSSGENSPAGIAVKVSNPGTPSPKRLENEISDLPNHKPDTPVATRKREEVNYLELLPYPQLDLNEDTEIAQTARKVNSIASRTFGF
jgi:Ring finger domain